MSSPSPLRIRLACAFRAALGLGLLAATGAHAQFIPYYGKNKITYDNFAWRVYKSPHFEIYFYPEFEPHLARLASYAESAYQKVSSTLKHEISRPIPLVLYKTHSEFEQTNLDPGFIPEGVAAFAEPVRGRMVLPIDEPPDQLQGLITHELTHIFEFDIIPRGLVSRAVPLWLDEGLADYMRGLWEPLDLMAVRDAAVNDQIPRMSRFNAGYADLSNPRLLYNLGHAAFEFIEARFGKEGIRQFLYTFRKNVVGGGVEDIYQQAFRLKPEEFDEAFDKWLKERFKPFRDRQRPSDYGRDLAPDSEKTSYTQVFAFAPSPSGEVIAALTANRADGEADLVLLSARDGTIIRNLTKGYTNRYEDVSFNDNFTAGRTIAFDPRGDTIAFFARTGKRRSLMLVSVLSGKVLRKIPVELDQTQSPCLLPSGREVIFAGLRDGVSDLFLMDLETGEVRNLTMDSFNDADPAVSPDGNLVVYTRRVSGHEKVYLFPLANPARRVQLTFGAHDDVTPSFSPDGQTVYYASTEDDDIYNVRSLDLRTGAIRQHTDVLGGNMAPAVLPSAKGTAERLAFISYFKGEYRLQTLDLTASEPVREVDQDLEAAEAEPVDFQADLVHQVVPENKRRKRALEKLFLQGRPPINVALTSSGDVWGGTAIGLSDVLGDHNFIFQADSVRDFRSYVGAYQNLSHRWHYGAQLYDLTYFAFASPYDLFPYSREGALFTYRMTGGFLYAEYPFDLYRRLQVSAGIHRRRDGFANTLSGQAVADAAAGLGTDIFTQNGTVVPLRATLVAETTRFREFGPLSGHTYAVGFEVAPGLGSAFLSRRTVDVDLRHYLRLGGTAVLATRVRAFHSTGDIPDYTVFGGNMELRGYPYNSFVGHEAFFANVELRLPIIDVMKTPLGLLGPVRGAVFAGMGGARLKGDPFRFSSREPGVSYVRFDPNDPLTYLGEPVSGLHLVDGRASFGFGLQFFFLGLPMHFDWTKLTDLKIHTPFRFDFWIGYDF
jgi:hypothetical protein